MSAAASPAERRLFERFTVRYPARIKDTNQAFGESMGLRDASAWGVRIVSKDFFRLHDMLTLEVELPDHPNPMTISGRVVWVKEQVAQLWDVGIKCAKIDFLHMSRLYELAA